MSLPVHTVMIPVRKCGVMVGIQSIRSCTLSVEVVFLSLSDDGAGEMRFMRLPSPPGMKRMSGNSASGIEPDERRER